MSSLRLYMNTAEVDEATVQRAILIPHGKQANVQYRECENGYCSDRFRNLHIERSLVCSGV